MRRSSASTDGSGQNAAGGDFTSMSKTASADINRPYYETIRLDQPELDRSNENGQQFGPITAAVSANQTALQRNVSLGDGGDLTVVDNAFYGGLATGDSRYENISGGSNEKGYGSANHAALQGNVSLNDGGDLTVVDNALYGSQAVLVNYHEDSHNKRNETGYASATPVTRQAEISSDDDGELTVVDNTLYGSRAA
jgi:hypothetical protein